MPKRRKGPPVPHDIVMTYEVKRRMRRCPECGGRVLMPCYACGVKRWMKVKPKNYQEDESLNPQVPEWLT